eukprot:TRINITY_DN4956_c1_g1_i7.p1 TRINITY_DN4956_c1_g1~~TRINITY_DN4956_c1_g1_i7.p1  ORF type:complete len:1778 (+),score=430.47 TRINITY_DN4956_c1_g1_i7:79-5412(+)
MKGMPPPSPLVVPDLMHSPRLPDAGLDGPQVSARRSLGPRLVSLRTISGTLSTRSSRAATNPHDHHGAGANGAGVSLRGFGETGPKLRGLGNRLTSRVGLLGGGSMYCSPRPVRVQSFGGSFLKSLGFAGATSASGRFASMRKKSYRTASPAGFGSGTGNSGDPTTLYSPGISQTLGLSRRPGSFSADSLVETRMVQRSREHTQRAKFASVTGKGLRAEAWGGGRTLVQKKSWCLGWVPHMTEFWPGKRWTEAGFGPRLEELADKSWDEVLMRYPRWALQVQRLDTETRARYKRQWEGGSNPAQLREFVHRCRESLCFVVSRIGRMPCQDGTEALHHDIVRDSVLDQIVAGILTGIKVVLAAVVYASLVFSSKGEPGSAGRIALENSFGKGITLMLWTSLVAGAWNSLFGRLQYSIAGSRIVPAVILSEISEELAIDPTVDPDKIFGILLIIICITSLSTGLLCYLVGLLRAADIVLRMPSPVTAGFLASVGWSAMRSSIRISSSIAWYNPQKTPGKWWPKEWDTDTGFWSPNSICPVLCAVGMFLAVKYLAPLCREIPGNWHRRYWTLLWTLIPLGLFALAITIADINISTLRDGWVFQQAENGTDFWLVWQDIDPGLVSDIPSSVVIKMILHPVLTVVAALLTLMASTSAFPEGHPDGAPDQFDQLDYSQEMKSLGAANVLTGLTGGIGVYHVIGFTIDHRNDGGTHRLSILISMMVVAGVFFSSVTADLASYFPKFFVAGIYLNMGWVLFDKGVLTPFKALGFSKRCECRAPNWLPFSGSGRVEDGRSHCFPCFSPMLLRGLMEWSVTAVCILVAMFTELVWGVAAAVFLAFVIHIQEVSAERPFASEHSGHVSHVRSTRKRPPWEADVLATVGSRAVALELKGALFFGTVESVSTLLETVLSANTDAEGDNDIEYIILDFRKVVSIDGSAGKLFARCRQACKRANVVLLYSGVEFSPAVRTAIEAFDIVPERPEVPPSPRDPTYTKEPSGGFALQKPSAQALETQVQVHGVWFNCKLVKKRQEDGVGWLYEADLIPGLSRVSSRERDVPATLLRKRLVPASFSTLDSALDWVETSLIDDYYYKHRRLLAADYTGQATASHSPHHFEWLEGVLLCHLQNPRDLVVPPTWGEEVVVDWKDKVILGLQKLDSVSASLDVTISNLEVVYVNPKGAGRKLGVRQGMFVTYFDHEPVWELGSTVQDDADLDAQFQATPHPVITFRFADRVWHAAPTGLAEELLEEHQRTCGMRRDPADGRLKLREDFSVDEDWETASAGRSDLDCIGSWLEAESTRWRVDLSTVARMLRDATSAQTEPRSPNSEEERTLEWISSALKRAAELRQNMMDEEDLSTTLPSVQLDDAKRQQILVNARAAQLMSCVVESSVAICYRAVIDGGTEIPDDVMAHMMEVPKETIFELRSFCEVYDYACGDTVFSPGSNLLRAPRSEWRGAKVMVRPQRRQCKITLTKSGLQADEALGVELDGLTVKRVLTDGAAWKAGVRTNWQVVEVGASETSTALTSRTQFDDMFRTSRRPLTVTLRLRIPTPMPGTVLYNLREGTCPSAVGCEDDDNLSEKLWLHRLDGTWHTEAPLDIVHLVRLEDESFGVQEFTDDEMVRLGEQDSPEMDSTAVCFIRQGCLESVAPGSISEDAKQPERDSRRTARQSAGHAAGEAQFLLSGEGRAVAHSLHTFVQSPTVKIWSLPFEKWLMMQQPETEGGSPELHSRMLGLFLQEMASDSLVTDASAQGAPGALWDGDPDVFWGLELSDTNAASGDAQWV